MCTTLGTAAVCWSIVIFHKCQLLNMLDMIVAQLNLSVDYFYHFPSHTISESADLWSVKTWQLVYTRTRRSTYSRAFPVHYKDLRHLFYDSRKIRCDNKDYGCVHSYTEHIQPHS